MKPRSADQAEDGYIPFRQRNYRVKFRDGYRCQHEGCRKERGLAVVKVGKGSADENYSTRCEQHFGKRQPEPGQWPGRSDRFRLKEDAA